MAKPVVERQDTEIRVCWPDAKIGVIFTRVHDRSDGIRAEMSVHYLDVDGHPNGLLDMANVGLLQPNTRKATVQKLGVRAQGTDWERVLDEACIAALRAWRAGPTREQAGGSAVVPTVQYLIDELLPAGKPTQWYGAGGSGKGYLSVLAGVCVHYGRPCLGRAAARGNVLYLDWEDDKDDLTRRIQEVSRGLGLAPPEFQYERWTSRLADHVDAVAEAVRVERIALVIVDSVTGAGGPISEHGGYEMVAQQLMAAVRRIPATVLLIDHVSDAGRTSPEVVGKSYGSIRKRDLCRSAWEVKADQEPGEDYLDVGLYHTKANHSRRFRPIGVRVTWTAEGAVTFDQRDVRASPVLSQATSKLSRMDWELRQGALTVKDLAQRLGEKEHTIYTRLIRNPGRYVNLMPDAREEGKAALWGLTSM